MSISKFKFIFSQNFEDVAPLCLASSVSNEKSDASLIPVTLWMTCFFLSESFWEHSVYLLII